jgi:DNA polymerase
VFLDTETFSETPIKNGTYIYAQNAEAMIVTYAAGMTDPVKVWDVTDGSPMPGDLEYMLEDDDEVIVAHNSMFDRNVLRLGNFKREIPIHRWRDTMVQAMAHALPGGLDKLCGIFGVSSDLAKDKEGKALIQLFCKPRPKNSTVRRATRLTHPVEWAKFIEYAKTDISAMRELARMMPRWNYSHALPASNTPWLDMKGGQRELLLWHLDQRINDRGVCVDTELAEGAILTVEREQKVLKTRTIEMTDGMVESTRKRDQLLMFLLEEHGVELPNLQSDTLERRINDPDIPEELRELLRIRLQVCTTSTSKYKALVKATTSNGRLSGTLQFNGAGRTRRAAGRTFQPQNLPRYAMDEIAAHLGISIKEVTPEAIDMYLEEGIAAIKAGCADLFFNKVMALCSNAVRSCIVAPEGKRLVVADLANIEGRDQAWLAGEEWKMQAFRAYDDGSGPDAYKLAYAKAFGVSPSDVGKAERQIGKVMELMLGYEGGVGAYLTGAATYNIDLDAMAVAAKPSIPAHIWADVQDYMKWVRKARRNTFGLSDEVFMVCDSLKRMWREAHPAISSYWGELQATAITALQNPGTTFTCRKTKIRADGAWLRVEMPSGRSLCYPHAKLDEKNKITYMGMNQYTRQWQRLGTYGGKMFENLAQGLARDVLYDNMIPVEQAGYEIVLSVHDELITEAPDNDAFNHKHLSSLIATNPIWCPDMPLAAAGFTAYRYKKE